MGKRGEKYEFHIKAPGHPFMIKTADGEIEYTDGVSARKVQDGMFTFTVPDDAPEKLIYVCEFRSQMVGSILIAKSASKEDSPPKEKEEPQQEKPKEEKPQVEADAAKEQPPKKEEEKPGSKDGDPPKEMPHVPVTLPETVKPEKPKEDNIV